MTLKDGLFAMFVIGIAIATQGCAGELYIGSREIHEYTATQRMVPQCTGLKALWGGCNPTAYEEK